MSADRVIASFLVVARQDLDGAIALAKAGNRNAAYLCEQAAEKIIRAVSTSESQHAGTGHRLAEIVEKLPAANPIRPLLEELTDLAQYATTYRYPTAGGRVPDEPAQDDLRASIELVERVLDEVSRRFGVDVVDRKSVAKKPGPIR